MAFAESCDGVNWTKPALGMWDAEEHLSLALPAPTLTLPIHETCLTTRYHATS